VGEKTVKSFIIDERQKQSFTIWDEIEILLVNLLNLCSPRSKSLSLNPWILSKYFPCVRASVRPSVRPPTDKRRVCILCVKQHINVVF
jgi:hypothetical protein